jgi:hypothetical protein
MSAIDIASKEQITQHDCDKIADGNDASLFLRAISRCSEYVPVHTNVKCVEIAKIMAMIMGNIKFLESLYGYGPEDDNTAEYVQFLLDIGYTAGTCPGYEYGWMTDLDIVYLICTNNAMDILTSDIVDNIKCLKMAMEYGHEITFDHFKRALNMIFVDVLELINEIHPEWVGEVGEPDGLACNDCPDEVSLCDLQSCHAMGHSFGEAIICSQIYDDNLPVLTYIHENGGKLNAENMTEAIRNNSIKCAEYLVKLGFEYEDILERSLVRFDNSVTSMLKQLLTDQSRNAAKRKKIFWK